MSRLGRDELNLMISACREFMPAPGTLYSKVQSIKSMGQVKVDDDYQFSHMKIDIQRHHGDERALLETVLHEWIHVCTSPMESYRDAVNAAVDKKTKKVLEVIRTNADERMTVQLTESLAPHVWKAYLELKKSKKKKKKKRSKS